MVQHAALSVTPAAEAHALNRSAAFASIAVALGLCLVKGWAARSTGSSAMLGSLADTALDLIASLVTLAGVWVAAQPEDAGHALRHHQVAGRAVGIGGE